VSHCRQLICGELHYPRIPHEYWHNRLAMARAMGLNAISTYVFWNRHEQSEGDYDFEGGNDVAQFIRLAQQHGLSVVLRPGPYVCAEWDFGGLPAWLLKGGEIPLRSTDERFMAPVRRWLARLGKELAPLQSASGGPIIAVQLENEYGAFGSDREYLRVLRHELIAAGFGESPFYTIDQPGDLARGSLDDLPMAITFAPGDASRQFAKLRELRPDAPLLCGEYWAGWYDHWGRPRVPLDDDRQIRDLEWMLAQGVSVNIYMFHGGTNFGFWNGANVDEHKTYQPTTTSYDYQAALDEAGRPTPKYWRFRQAIAAHTGITPPAVPLPPRIASLPAVTLNCCAPLTVLLRNAFRAGAPFAMEVLGQNFGFVLYRTSIDVRAGGTLQIEGLRDYALIMLEGRPIAHLDRRLGESTAQLPPASDRATLDILVENCGRVNYGAAIARELKGITGNVLLNGKPLRDWEMYCLPLERLAIDDWSSSSAPDVPAFYRGEFELTEAADTFVDASELHKGVLWVNGHNAGRFWKVGPQRALYVPGVWLQAGRNTFVALDLFAHDSFPVLRSWER
jgi:beta-galactosidase